jgi:hypothetical protein
MKSLSFALALTCALITSACTPNVREVFCNNTGHDIVLMCEHTKGVITNYPLKTGASVEIGLYLAVTIRGAEPVWTYSSVEVPSSYYERLHFGKRLLKQQIEKDGRIFVVPPGTIGPIANFPVQPPGYPLTPL